MPLNVSVVGHHRYRAKVRLGYLSPGWLRIDPTFAPLRRNPRFEQLVAGE